MPAVHACCVHLYEWMCAVNALGHYITGLYLSFHLTLIFISLIGGVVFSDVLCRDFIHLIDIVCIVFIPADPVFFASQCGAKSRLPLSPTALTAGDASDQRLSSLHAAVEFAKTNNLLGVFLDADVLVRFHFPLYPLFTFYFSLPGF